MNNKLGLSKQRYNLGIMFGIAIVLLEFGILYILPEPYRPYFALVVSISILLEVLILSPFKKVRPWDEINVPSFFAFLALFFVGGSLFFVLFDLSYYIVGWITSMISISSLVNTVFLFRYLRNRKIIS